MLKKIVTAVALVSACGLASSAMAATAKKTGFYVDGYLGINGASVGNFKNSVDKVAKSWGLVFGVGGGYKLMSNLAVDVSYMRPVVLRGAGGHIHLNEFILAAKGIVPLGGGFSLYGKFGPAISRYDVGFYQNVTAVGKTAVTLYAGIGGEYNITPNMFVGVLGSYFMKKGDLDLANSNNNLGSYRPAMWAVTANFGYLF